jgi:ABC-2 type transport system ATP-binding protein
MESVCDRVLVIHRGRLLLDRSVAALRSGFLRRKRVTLRTVEPDPQVSVPGATIVERGPHRVVLDVDPATQSIGAVVAAAIATVRLEDLSVEDPPFEEVVKAIYASADAGPVAPSPRAPGP